ncbi:MAG: NAD(P)-dependent oxidoreductase [Chloroflexi bacterium]|nr:NAD(P)-dependent oxidoreductase [Chloroflexota bacterium]
MTGPVGIISAGDMGAAIGAMLTSGGVDVATDLTGRSELTRTRAAEAGMRDAGSTDALVEECDLLLSVLPIAEEVAGAMARTGSRPAFAECNAIAPQTVVRIATLMLDTGAPFIDAGIIGSPPSPGSDTRIYCSGPDTSALESLRECGLDIRRVGPRFGQASGLKMVYAASTKGTTAVWTELLTAAEAMGLTDALLAEFGDAVDPARRIKATTQMPRRARRWVGEMEEIAATFEHLGLTPRILLGAADMFRLTGETALAEQTSREPDPELREMLRVLAEQARAGNQQG